MWFSRLYSLPLLFVIRQAGIEDLVVREMSRWVECLADPALLEASDRDRFAIMVTRLKEFRSLIHYRLRHLSFFVRFPLRVIWPGEASLVFGCDDIGAGLFIQHGFSTGVDAVRIGTDCWINQQVTVGHTAKGKPTIGDRVTIGAGAVVLGPITIGDDAVIGANATVVTDVPAGAVFAGPRAKEIARRPPTATQSCDGPASVAEETFGEGGGEAHR